MSSAVGAVPVYYTFEGAISSIKDPDNHLSVGDGFGVGESVNYTFLVDFDETGTWQYDGSNSFRTVSISDTSSRDYFYSALVSGSPVVSRPYFDYNVTNYGLESQPGYSAYGALTGSNYLSIVNSRLNVSDWVVGTSVVGNDYWGTFSQSFYVRSNLVLTDIVEPITSVPEPQTAILFSAGLFTLLVIRRRVKRDRAI